ncbi:MAG: DUF4185 domain-containing protein [Clostridia bacterium]|nr:DUF4185 domain-containing protein [Clostridia bacterium]
MKRNILKAILSTAALFPLMLFCSCGHKAPAETTQPPVETPAITTATEDTPVPDDGKVRFVEDGEGKAVLVRAENASKTVSNAVSALRNYIKDVSGCRLDALLDSNAPERADIEIIIGDTNRMTAADADVSKGSFSIFVEKNDGKTSVYLLGGTDFHVQYAVEFFMAKCIEGDGSTLFVDSSLKKQQKILFNDYEEKGLNVVAKVKDINLSTRNTDNKESSLSAVTNIHAVAMLTGEYSLNRTRSMYNICGTDLGFPVYHNGKLWFFFGDTFSEGEMKGGWRTNTAAYTTDLVFADGIIFDGMYSTSSDGTASELIKGLKKPYTEYSKIPTGAISLNGTLYFYFMSVNNWDSAAGWDCNYGGLAKSTDDGKTWSIVSGVQWPGDSKYCQNSPVLNEADGKVYITGITGGRQGFARMMRVDKDKIEDLSAYEYLTGYNSDNTPIWTKGEEGIRKEFALIDGKVSENTIVYNEYLGEWMITYKKDSVLHLYTAKTPAGPYACSAKITFPSIGAGLYGGFTCSALMTDGGRKMALIMSTWEPCYNTFILEMTLSKK